MWSFELAIVVAMIGVNGVFAGYEIALASVTRARLQRLAGQSRRGARVALYMKGNMEASLAVVQLGITLVGATAAAVGGAGAAKRVAPAVIAMLGLSPNAAEVAALALVVVPLTIATITFGELIPKVFSLRNAEWVCLTFSPMMRWFSFAVWPAVWLFESIVTGIMSWGERRLRGRVGQPETAELQELRASAALARASRLIGHRQEGIIVGATEMQARTVREIMLPAEHMCTLDAGASLAENLSAAHRDMHTRFPVLDRKGDPQTVIGYVNVKDIVATLQSNTPQMSLRAIVRPLPSFQYDQPIAACLEQLMREHTHMALIRDATGRVLGMISLEDIIEELVGEIEDEYDRLPSYIIPSGTTWVVGGGASLERVKARTGIDLAAGAPDVHRLNEWVEARLGRDIRGGDVVEDDAFRVLVRKVRRKRVQEALLSRLSVARQASGEGP